MSLDILNNSLPSSNLLALRREEGGSDDNTENKCLAAYIDLVANILQIKELNRSQPKTFDNPESEYSDPADAYLNLFENLLYKTSDSELERQSLHEKAQISIEILQSPQCKAFFEERGEQTIIDDILDEYDHIREPSAFTLPSPDWQNIGRKVDNALPDFTVEDSLKLLTGIGAGILRGIIRPTHP